MKKLVEGIVRFRRERRPGYKEQFAHLSVEQQPDTLLVCCSDSRVAPNIFASTEPGDVFVVRNPGKFLDIYHAKDPDFQKTTQRVYRSATLPSHIKLNIMP